MEILFRALYAKISFKRIQVILFHRTKRKHIVCVSNPAYGSRHGLGKNYVDSVLNGNAHIMEYENPTDQAEKTLIFIRKKDRRIMELHGPGNSEHKTRNIFKIL